ncbi:steroid delta-isomerase [beta proteobacterium AAP99]|nr:steroid delta-isomerase [beta proteobacterium AAP99]
MPLTTNNPAEVPVQEQLDAYNAHDVARFVACYTEDVQVFRLPGTEPAMVGRAAMAVHYSKHRFNIPTLHAELVNRMVMGNKVIDHERIHGVREAPYEAAAIYEVRGGLIATVWFLNPE